MPNKTIDILIVNTGSEHTPLAVLIDKIVKLLGPKALLKPNWEQEKELHDEAFDMAREFFREGARYRR